MLASIGGREGYESGPEPGALGCRGEVVLFAVCSAFESYTVAKITFQLVIVERVHE